MEIVKSNNLTYEYVMRDDYGEVENVFKALDGVDISINKGEFVAILGHNGSGKSTLAKHLNALLTPTDGTLWIKGLDSKGKDNTYAIRQTAGMVFQNPDNQIIASIVEEDVAFGPENLGLKPERIRKRVDKALETVEMTDYQYHSPNKLSGGQKQRIAIAGVLAMRPSCIVLDEPTAMLDPWGREEVIERIKLLNKEEGMTIILITHYMEEAAIADRVIVMENGKIQLDGKPKEVFSKVDEMKDLGLDVPEVTELSYMLRKDGFDIDKEITNIEEMVDQICQLKLKN